MKRTVRHAVLMLAGVILTTACPPQLFADANPTRVLEPGKMPADSRLGPAKNLNGYFPMTVPATKEAWEVHRKELREQVLVANGLWPMPEKTPLNAVIHGKIDRDDYTVEKVFFASHAGPLRHRQPLPARQDGKAPGKLPGVLCPHGHWANGRFYEAGEKQVAGPDQAGSRKDDEEALAIRCRPAVLSSPAWAASSSTTTWSATPTASVIAHRERLHRRRRPSCACRASWACKPGTASAPSTSC